LERTHSQSSQNPEQIQKPKSSGIAEKPKMEYLEPWLLVFANSDLGGFMILDVRSPAEYELGHIIGARNLFWKDLRPKGSLEPAIAEEALRRLGVKNEDRLLVYGGAEDAPYAFWALSYLGHRNVSILKVNKDQLNEKSRPQSERSNYTAHILPELLVNGSMLSAWLSQKEIQILDARDFVEYGKSRLTNASLPLDSSKLYDGSAIKDASALEDLFSRSELDRKKVQLVYGEPGAYSLFYALSLMGYNATLIEGSWWSGSKFAVSTIKNNSKKK
jgi:3-mercaptopyruvate sulfurtransferase SseA